jgi:hypothetical protein
LWAFIFRADAIPGSDLKTIYATGVKSVPVIGKLFFSTSDTDRKDATPATPEKVTRTR